MANCITVYPVGSLGASSPSLPEAVRAACNETTRINLDAATIRRVSYCNDKLILHLENDNVLGVIATAQGVIIQESLSGSGHEGAEALEVLQLQFADSGKKVMWHRAAQVQGLIGRSPVSYRRSGAYIFLTFNRPPSVCFAPLKQEDGRLLLYWSQV